jgi:mannosyltransferase OCH1-like enzyme
MIPKIIHQTWNTQDVPYYLRDFQKSWINEHPTWDYWLWTEEDNFNFIKNNYSFFLDTYTKYTKYIQKADAIRYFLLYHYGGIYADLDFQALRSMDDLIVNKELVFGAEPLQHAKEQKRSVIIGNAIMMSVPRHDFWKNVFNELITRSHSTDVLYSTGPFLITDMVLKYHQEFNITVYKPPVLYPILDVTCNKLFKGNLNKQRYIDKITKPYYYKYAYAIHYWSGAWLSKAKQKNKENYINTLIDMLKNKKLKQSIYDVNKFTMNLSKYDENDMIEHFSHTEYAYVWICILIGILILINSILL